MTTTTARRATIRFIAPDNANSLGYSDADYDEDGLWVLEENGDEWSADLRDITETDVAAAKAAEDILGTAGTWERLDGNYGLAYGFHRA